MNSDNNDYVKPTINAYCSSTVKSINGSMRNYNNQILIDNHRINNNNRKAVE